MKTALHLCGILALLAATVALGEVAFTVHRLRPKAELTLEHVNRATIAAGAAAGNVEKASRAWEQASKEQASKTSSAMSNVSAAAKQLTLFVSNTDSSLNSSLLPTLTAAIGEQSATLSISEKELQTNLQQMSQATMQLQGTLADADKVIADPNLRLAIENLTKSSENTAEATKHLANVADAGEQTARYYQKKLTTPASFAQQLFRFVLNAGSQARILLAK